MRPESAVSIITLYNPALQFDKTSMMGPDQLTDALSASPTINLFIWNNFFMQSRIAGLVQPSIGMRTIPCNAAADIRESHSLFYALQTTNPVGLIFIT